MGCNSDDSPAPPIPIEMIYGQWIWDGVQEMEIRDDGVIFWSFTNSVEYPSFGLNVPVSYSYRNDTIYNHSLLTYDPETDTFSPVEGYTGTDWYKVVSVDETSMNWFWVEDDGRERTRQWLRP